MIIDFDSRGLRVTDSTIEQYLQTNNLPVPIQFVSKQIMTVDFANLKPPLTKEIKIGRSIFAWHFYGDFPNCTVSLRKIGILAEPVTKWMNNERVIVKQRDSKGTRVVSDETTISFPVDDARGLKINGQSVDVDTMDVGTELRLLQHKNTQLNYCDLDGALRKWTETTVLDTTCSSRCGPFQAEIARYQKMVNQPVQKLRRHQIDSDSKQED